MTMGLSEVPIFVQMVMGLESNQRYRTVVNKFPRSPISNANNLLLNFEP